MIQGWPFQILKRSDRGQVQRNSVRGKIAQRVICAVCFALILLSGAPAFSQGQVVELAAFNYPPFYYEEEGEVRGIAVDLINEVFGRLNLQANVHIYPLSRALSYLKSGSRDGIMILINTPERARYIKYTEPVMTVRGLIWSSANRSEGPVNYESLEDLRAYRVGVTRGYSYGPELDAVLKTMDVDTANADLFNFRKLTTGRIDVFPGNEIVAKGLFKKFPDLNGKVVHSEKSFIEWVLHMGISKRSWLTSMLPEINEALLDMKREGVIDATVRKYTQ